eukprot:1277727-Pleurochrysis_carterae.AAC.2
MGAQSIGVSAVCFGAAECRYTWSLWAPWPWPCGRRAHRGSCPARASTARPLSRPSPLLSPPARAPPHISDFKTTRTLVRHRIGRQALEHACGHTCGAGVNTEKAQVGAQARAMCSTGLCLETRLRMHERLFAVNAFVSMRARPRES